MKIFFPDTINLREEFPILECVRSQDVVITLIET